MGLTVINRESANELALATALTSTIKSSDIAKELLPIGPQILVLAVETTAFTSKLRDGSEVSMVNVYLATNAGNVFIKSDQAKLKFMAIGQVNEPKASNLDWLDREIVLWSESFCTENGIVAGSLLEGVKIVSQETTETPVATSPEFMKQPLKETRKLADGTFTQSKEIVYSVDNKKIYKTVVVVPDTCTGPEFRSVRIQRAVPKTISMADLMDNSVA